MKLPFILWFLTGPFQTPADITGARDLRANVAFRNGSVVPADGALEHCDGVAGAVPARYAAAYPTAAQALETYEAALTAAAAKVGGTAPTAAPAPEPEPAPAPVGGEKPATPKAADAAKAGWKPNV